MFLRRTTRLIAVFVLAGLAGVAQASLLTNGDFDTDLSGWGVHSQHGVVPAWTDTVPDGGGVLYGSVADQNLFQTSAPAMSTNDLVLAFDVGSVAGNVTKGKFYARLYVIETNSWATAVGAVTVSASQLNQGLQTYAFQFTDIVSGYHYEANMQTIGVNSSATILLDHVTLTQVPEPATMGLLMIGGLGALLRRRK